MVSRRRPDRRRRSLNFGRPAVAMKCTSESYVKVLVSRCLSRAVPSSRVLIGRSRVFSGEGSASVSSPCGGGRVRLITECVLLCWEPLPLGPGSPSSRKGLASAGRGDRRPTSVESRGAGRQAEGAATSKQLALLPEEARPPSPTLPGPGMWAAHWALGTDGHSACQLPPACPLLSLIDSAAAALLPFAKIGVPACAGPDAVEGKGPAQGWHSPI